MHRLSARLVGLIVAVLLPLAAAAGSARLPDSRADESLYFGDETVSSPTRVAKPLSQIAENVTVVHSDEIEAMNAHTLTEVLNRVTGVFVQFFGHHFGATSLPHIQGSGETDIAHMGSNDLHVTVLLDGMPWNTLSGGPFVESIPVGLIDRIEIIKGPASSTWGSALGGVINVLTKKVGKTAVPGGGLSASYGERETWDLRGEAAGAAGPAGYYVYAQRQHAEWSGDEGGGYKSWAGFGKAEVLLGPKATLSLSAGKSRSQQDEGDLASFGALAQNDVQARFARLGFDVRLTDSLTFSAAGYRYDQHVIQPTQEDGTYGPRGDLVQDGDSAERHAGGQGRLAWTLPGNTVVLGVDCAKGQIDLNVDSGAFFQSLGVPAHVEATPSLWQWGVYLNDTVTLGRLTLTPGIRYDHPSLSRSFTSPSLGAAWRVGDATVLRASVARGFTLPALNTLDVASNGTDPNPDLKPEQVWSYQAGAETGAIGFLWLKATVFRHEVSDSFVQGPSSGPNGITTVNSGSTWRTGFELEAETVRFGGLSAKAGFAYVKVDKVGLGRDQDVYQANAQLSYQRGPWKAAAFGHFVWWDLGSGAHEGRHDDFVWDANVSRTFALSKSVEADVFTAVHNAFNGNQEFDTDRGMETRWVEGGVRLRF